MINNLQQEKWVQGELIRGAIYQYTQALTRNEDIIMKRIMANELMRREIRKLKKRLKELSKII